MEEEEKDKKDEEEYVKKDPVWKFQYDYNNITCMTNKVILDQVWSLHRQREKFILKDKDKSKLLEM